MSRTVSREDLDDQVLNPRLIREKAHVGAITASLVWNGHTDFDLHAHVNVDGGKREHIFFRSKQGTGGALDVDANAGSNVVDDPVENIYWDKPPAGKYEISVNNYRQSGDNDAFRVRLMLPKETLDYEGRLKPKQTVRCFSFTVDDEGSVAMGKIAAAKIMRKPSRNYLLAGRRVGAPKGKAKAKARTMKAVRTMRKVMKRSMKKTMKKPRKSMKVAQGKNSKAKVFLGRFEKTAGGLKKEHLMKSRSGKIVSKKMSAQGKRMYSNVESWIGACKKARTELGLTGFVATKKGTPFYEKAREIYEGSL